MLGVCREEEMVGMEDRWRKSKAPRRVGKNERQRENETLLRERERGWLAGRKSM